MTKIRGEKLVLLGGKRDGESGGGGKDTGASRPPVQSKPSASKPKLDDFDDDIPF